MVCQIHNAASFGERTQGHDGYPSNSRRTPAAAKANAQHKPAVKSTEALLPCGQAVMLQQPDGTILVEGIVVPGEPAREIGDDALKRRQIPIRKPATVLEHVRVGTADAALGRFELAALSSKEIPGRVNRDRKAGLGLKP